MEEVAGINGGGRREMELSEAKLEVEENANLDAIRKQYHKLALNLHPDKNKHPKAEIAFKLVLEGTETPRNEDRDGKFKWDEGGDRDKISYPRGLAVVLSLKGQSREAHEEASKLNPPLLLCCEVALFFLLALGCAAKIDGDASFEKCTARTGLEPRPHSVSILEFGAVADGKTLNTIAFQNAIFYVNSFADKGGAQIYVPAGRWLTGSFNLTSHLTLFLERGATILASQDLSLWETTEPLPSYGRGIELPGTRYCSLITGHNLKDVVITGDNGTIDGQGSGWWELFNSQSLNHSRPYLVELINSIDIIVSNLTFLNSPSWNFHPVYCSNVQVFNVTIHTPPDSPYTSGIVPDSSNNVCIVNCTISVSHDAIVLKSGWDEYGIAYGKPTTDVQIKFVHLQASSGAGLAFGSEMSGGITNVRAEHLHVSNSRAGVKFKTTTGRGGFIQDILISDLEVVNVQKALGIIGQCGSHPDENFDPNALPVIQRITFKNIVGSNITIAGAFTGIQESPFTSICLFNISLPVEDPSNSWVCSYISGHSQSVFPEPCSDLTSSSSTCFSLLHSSTGLSAVL
ncbi:hypothetical protein Scep_008960 [Stephania cephalantha]|uniref:J domain-containing protein n=1 Tax=Stephania cephalantha TaxID=152367 RepID=A0AAP0JSZ5_9MAGN